MDSYSLGDKIANYFFAFIGAVFIGGICIFPVTFAGLYFAVPFFDSVFNTGISEWYKMHQELSLTLIGAFSMCVGGVISGITATEDSLNRKISDMQSDYKTQIASMEDKVKTAAQREKEILWYVQSLKTSLGERAAGFQSLHESIAELDKLVDEGLSNYLRSKRRPALSAADTVRRETKMRRTAEVEAKTARSIIEYYEQLFPELADIRQSELEGGEEEVHDVKYTERERQDPVTRLLAKSEYDKLSPQQRNQLALDRYWKRRHSPKELGRMYERYVGYLYESKGYSVEYSGINKGLEDLGRDLVCRKGKTIEVVQCKYWSQYKNVFENRIFQHFGTTFEYKMQNKGLRVIPVFYTTTKLSDTARKFAEVMKMKLVENHKFDKSYPCIKCNIGRDGSKIYHLPFDQQYNKVNIEPEKGEFFAKTVKEAEDAGFRRAYRWRGAKS